MKAGFLQFNPILGKSEKNVQKIKKLIDSAEEFDLIVLPELANSGYNFENLDEAMAFGEYPSNSPFINALIEICIERKCHIVSGFCERDDDNLFNSAVLLSGDGIKGTYRKIHLFNNEKDYFLPGNSQPQVYDIFKCRVGMLICFDWAFPEIWRILALKGADIVVHPANLVVIGGGHTSVPVHAMINSYFVITANRIGTENDLHFTGGSMIACPDGSVSRKAGEDDEKIEIVEINPAAARDKAITLRNDLLDDRRPELYDGLLD
ncbi:carbon-nitrogen hydrolase [bacterium]|nr:carbon-nitrogen hydrolase [bacterium]MBU1025590.1 carbon-nitrogen hydrolase [bacterium]